MSKWDTYKETLNKIFNQVKIYYTNNDERMLDSLSEEQKKWLTTLTENVENQKSVLAVTITSLLKKIVSPNQDVRLHRKELKGGYSGRSLDTNVVTPWLKEHFPRFAPKESGWLTRSIEQPRPFTMDFPGKIRNKEVKRAFLSILNDIEENSANPTDYLQCLLFLLLKKYEQEENLISQSLVKGEGNGLLTIDTVISMLREHFSTEKSSRLPVIAVYTMYQLFMENIKLYEDKKLEPLKTHTTSDRYTGFGDIEVYNSDGTPFEIVEIKHNIPIDTTMIKDSFRKIEGKPVKRYYILTTAEPNFKDSYEEILKLVHAINFKCGVEIIPNGICSSLKYYLRLTPDLNEYINRYTENLNNEFRKTTDIKEIHIKEWLKIRKKYNV